MAAFCSEGRPASRETAEELIATLEASKNYIPSSVEVRREYAHLLMKEYKRYVSDQERGMGVGP